MKKSKIAAIVLLSTFATSSIVLQLNKSETGKLLVNDVKQKIEAVSEKVYDDVDSFFVQALVESRYKTAAHVVWVYGCADKT